MELVVERNIKLFSFVYYVQGGQVLQVSFYLLLH